MSGTLNEAQSIELNAAALHWFNELSTQGILVTDAELNISTWNNWLVTHSARGAESMVGRNLLEAYPDLTTRRLDEYYKDALAGQVRVVSQRLHSYLLPMAPPIESDLFAKMQQSARIAPLVSHDNEGRVIGTITVIEDVTERVERENRLVNLLASEKAARSEAEAANRARDEFLATVSHELRTPLNAMFGWLQILRTTRFDNETLARALETVERSAKAQTKLIEDILDASRISTGKMRLDVREVDLEPIIEAVIDAVRPAADAKTISLHRALDEHTEPVMGDPNRLQQVIWNLLVNAIKFTPRGGSVTVRLARVDSSIEVSVIDTGQGISPEFLPHVFERFRQADSTTTRQHTGLGLGLAIVRHLVELHGGTVRAESKGVGLGAAFTIQLPLMPVQNADEFLASQDMKPGRPSIIAVGPYITATPPLEGLRVLIVDDEADARDMLNMMFLQCGADVKTASSTRDAIEMLRDWMPDVLISDIGMPGEDGYSLIKQVRALAPDKGGRVPAVALTGYAGSESCQRLLSAGYQVHVTKPVELEELTLLVARFTGREFVKPLATPAET
jgi:signal transduction histidine kinase/ActR/RegA family two-component response regulator